MGFGYQRSELTHQVGGFEDDGGRSVFPGPFQLKNDSSILPSFEVILCQWWTENVALRFPTKELKDALNEDRQNSAQQGRIVGQDVSKRMREAQDPLSYGRVSEYMVR